MRLPHSFNKKAFKDIRAKIRGMHVKMDVISDQCYEIKETLSGNSSRRTSNSRRRPSEERNPISLRSPVAEDVF